MWPFIRKYEDHSPVSTLGQKEEINSDCKEDDFSNEINSLPEEKINKPKRRRSR